VKIRAGKPAGVAKHTKRARELLGGPAWDACGAELFGSCGTRPH
jgi:hypothetical protein